MRERGKHVIKIMMILKGNKRGEALELNKRQKKEKCLKSLVSNFVVLFLAIMISCHCVFSSSL